MNKIKIITIFLIIILGGCAERWTPPVSEHDSDIIQWSRSNVEKCRAQIGDTGVSVAADGRLGCFFDEISDSNVKKFIDQGGKDVRVIVVNSGGGEVDAAIDVGEIILSNDVTIIVSGFCLSSCANYWFTSAKYKIVLSDSFVAWHGGPSYSLLSKEKSDEYNSNIMKKINRSDAFMERAGVRKNLFLDWPDDWPDDRKIPGSPYMWSYDKEKLERDFNVKGILYYQN